MKRSLLLVIAFLAAPPAFAYMGPGAGLGMLGSLVAVIGVVLVALFGIIVLPVRMVLKKRRKGGLQKPA